MTVELLFDFSRVESHHKKNKYNFYDEDTESTESTFYGEDFKAVEILFEDDNSSMCSEESMASSEDGTYTRTFGDEDSLVLAKGRYLHEEPGTGPREIEKEQEATALSLVYSSRADNILLQESTDSTLCGEDCRAFVDAFFDDDSSFMFSSSSSSSSKRSIASCQLGPYTRTFGDEDSLVLAKGRQQVPNVHIIPQAESILEGLTIVVPKPDIAYNSGSALRLLLNRRVRQGGCDATIAPQNGRPLTRANK